MKRILLILLLFCLSISVVEGSVFPEDGWYIHSHWGLSGNMPSVLSVHTRDFDMARKVKWASKSFDDSWYYSIKVEKWDKEKVKGLEWIHHKMYLVDTTDKLTNFSISDGYNLLFLNTGKIHDSGLITKMGAGIIMAHPDVTISGRDRFYMDGGIGGSYFAGFAAQYSLQKWFYESRYHVLSAEGKITAGYARIPISKDKDEFADVPHIALHFSFGIGSKPMKKADSNLKKYTNFIGVPFFHHYSIYLLE